MPTAVSPVCQPCCWTLAPRSPSRPPQQPPVSWRQTFITVCAWRGNVELHCVGAADRGWVGAVTRLPKGHAAGMNFPLVSGQI